MIIKGLKGARDLFPPQWLLLPGPAKTEKRPLQRREAHDPKVIRR